MLRQLEFILLFVGVLLTSSLTLLTERANDTTAKNEFQRLADDGTLRLDRKMQTYLQSLVATAAFLHNSEEVTPAEFAQYVDDLNIETMLPGINGIGLIEAINATDSAAFEQDMLAAGYSDFKIYPDTAGPHRYVISYIFPLAPNAPALGLDISFEEGRLGAANRSYELGQAQLTPRIILVQDDMKEPGFLLLLPLRSDGRKAWVYAPFVGRNLLENLTQGKDQSYVIHVYDGTVTDPDTLIYDSTPKGSSDGQYRATRQVEHFGRTWTVVFSSTPAFDATLKTQTPLLLLLSGLALTAMLVILLRNTRLRSAALREVAELRGRQIKAQEQENRSIIENAVTPVFILDDTDAIIFANQAARDCFGYDETGIQGLPFDDLVQETTKDGLNATGRTSGGRDLVLDLHRNTWTTEAGIKRVTAMVRDITAETNAHQEINRTKTLYDLALQGSRIGVFDLDLVANVSEVSDTWCRIMGFDGTCNGMNPQEAFMSRIHPQDIAILQDADAACIAGQTDRSIAEYRLKTQSGEWRWMRSDAVVSQRDPNGRALRLIGTQTDVTDLRHARNALEDSENQFRQVLAAAPIGTVVLDENWAFIDVNAAFSDLVCVPVETLKKQHGLKDFVYRTDLETICDTVRQLARDGAPEPYKAEHPFIQRGGAERLALFHVSWAYNKNKRENVFIAQIIDITEQRRIENLKNEFVSTVSHELRTPLTSIKGALGLITATREEGRSATVVRLLEIASSNADRLTAIVNDILDLEKISDGEVVFDIKSADIGDVITQAVSAISPFALTHNNTIKTSLPEGPLPVQVDAARTQQVLANFISNACKYATDHTAINVGVTRRGDMALVTVSNQGSGIPENFRPHLFEAFSQADGSDTRAKGGTGLGLNISRQIVKRQGGDIGFESEIDGETSFWFTCPLATDADGRKMGMPAAASDTGQTIGDNSDDAPARTKAPDMPPSPTGQE